MARYGSALQLKIVCTSLLLIPVLLSIHNPPASAITASIGQPYRGYLVNGIPFPTQFRGYQLREEERTYATPELIGAVLDAIERVVKKYPDTCDLYIGDISGPRGGRMSRHRSHENGRDIDLGMYARENRVLSNLAPMNEENLDVPKTWCLIESLLQSRRVQNIFVDQGLQKVLYRYAASQGWDENYLDNLFGVAAGPDTRTVIQHVRGHRDHLHVRFYTPWSSLAGLLDNLSEKQRGVIELAQGAYLPKKVNYFVQGNEPGIGALATSFGVSTRDLCRWNRLHGSEPLEPGSCLVFYKRGFEVEPVRLAQSLQPSLGIEIPVAVSSASNPNAPFKVASLKPATEAVSDMPTSIGGGSRFEHRSTAHSEVSTYRVRKGDTVARIARQNNLDPEVLCRLNGIKMNARLDAGRSLKLPATPKSSSHSIQPTDREATKGNSPVHVTHGKNSSSSSGKNARGVAVDAKARSGRVEKVSNKAPRGKAPPVALQSKNTATASQKKTNAVAPVAVASSNNTKQAASNSGKSKAQPTVSQVKNPSAASEKKSKTVAVPPPSPTSSAKKVSSTPQKNRKAM
jgi:murein endopeptidase/LysM repeat protein